MNDETFKNNLGYTIRSLQAALNIMSKLKNGTPIAKRPF
jgi:hypothetical protein